MRELSENPSAGVSFDTGVQSETRGTAFITRRLEQLAFTRTAVRPQESLEHVLSTNTDREQTSHVNLGLGPWIEVLPSLPSIQPDNLGRVARCDFDSSVWSLMRSDQACGPLRLVCSLLLWSRGEMDGAVLLTVTAPSVSHVCSLSVPPCL